MKIVCPVKEISVSQSNLAGALGVSVPRVNQLINEGVVVREPATKSGAVLLFDSLKNLFSKSSASADNDLSYWKEKTLEVRAKRELAEFKLAKAKGDVYTAKDVESALSEMVGCFRTELLGLPHRVAPSLENKNQDEIFEILIEEIEKSLEEISNFNTENLKSED